MPDRHHVLHLNSSLSILYPHSPLPLPIPPQPIGRFCHVGCTHLYNMQQGLLHEGLHQHVHAIKCAMHADIFDAWCSSICYMVLCSKFPACVNINAPVAPELHHHGMDPPGMWCHIFIQLGSGHAPTNLEMMAYKILIQEGDVPDVMRSSTFTSFPACNVAKHSVFSATFA